MASKPTLWPSHLRDGTAEMIFAAAADQLEVKVVREGCLGAFKAAPHALACPCLELEGGRSVLTAGAIVRFLSSASSLRFSRVFV